MCVLCANGMVRRSTGAEGWTAAEELALADHTKRMGLGSWEELSDMVRYARKTADIDVVLYVNVRSGFLLRTIWGT